jgi:hypothetical protein
MSALLEHVTRPRNFVTGQHRQPSISVNTGEAPNATGSRAVGCRSLLVELARCAGEIWTSQKEKCRYYRRFRKLWKGTHRRAARSRRPNISDTPPTPHSLIDDQQAPKEYVACPAHTTTSLTSPEVRTGVRERVFVRRTCQTTHERATRLTGV